MNADIKHNYYSNSHLFSYFMKTVKKTQQSLYEEVLNKLFYNAEMHHRKNHAIRT